MSELLRVHADEFAGPLAFVAPDHGPGRPVEPRQAVQAVAGQDPVDGRGGQAQDRADAGGAELAGAPRVADAGLQARAKYGKARPVYVPQN